MDQNTLDKIFEVHQRWLNQVKKDPYKIPHRLRNAYIVGDDLHGLDLTSYNFDRARLINCNLVGAKFTHELLPAFSLNNCTMTWDKAPWYVNHPSFKWITFV